MNEHQPHYVWAFVVILVASAVAWAYSSNRSDVENYGKGSTHPESTYHNSPFSINIGQGGCATIGELMKHKEKAKIKEDVKHKEESDVVILNSVSK